MSNKLESINPNSPILLSYKKIWDRAAHNALTDLIRFNNLWICTFRESTQHALGADGMIRLIASEDGLNWDSIALLGESGVDLRDPKLSVTPEGTLMLLTEGVIYSPKRKKYVSRQSRVAFSQNAKDWTPFKTILEPHEWLWRITWFEGKGYGASYRYSNPKSRYDEWLINLFETSNGIDYQLMTHWNIPGYPNETTIRFSESGEMIALVRREDFDDNRAWIGTSPPPYKKWNWNVSNTYFGGPNFLILPDQSQWAAGRVLYVNPYGMFAKTVLAEMNLKKLNPVIYLPSSGDSSYPGMIFEKGILWISYYSSHENNTAIYLAKIAISPSVLHSKNTGNLL